MKHILKMGWKPWSPGVPKEFTAPRLAPWLPGFLDLVGPFYARWGLGLRSVKLVGEESLAGYLAEDRRSGTRTILAFRHCGDADPQAVYWALNSLTKGSFRRAGLSKRPELLVLASAEIALWGGAVASIMLKMAGTLPLSHGTGGRKSLEWLRKYLSGDQEKILVLAPEGQITYDLEAPIRLDSGIASMVQWSGISRTRVVPLGLIYRCPDETWERWAQFMDLLDQDCGVKSREESPQKRLIALWSHLISKGEEFYASVHGMSFPDIVDAGQGPTELSLRCRRLAETACTLACRVRGLDFSGDVRGDNFRLRAANLEVVTGGSGDSALDRYTRLRACREAFWTNRHQELSDLLVNLDPDRLPPSPTLDQAVESALNLADFAGRLSGGTVAHRPRFFRRRLEITLGQALPGTPEESLPPEKQGTKAWKQNFLELLKTEMTRLSRW